MIQNVTLTTQTPLPFSKAKKCFKYQISGFDKSLDAGHERRLLELGFTKGVYLIVLERSILNDVILVELSGYILSLRTSIAKHILVTCEQTVGCKCKT